jgi:hypothetical protein
MSVISNIHTAIVYEAKGQNKSVPFDGQRGVVTIAKADKNGNYGEHLQQTMFTSIPQLSDSDINWDNTIKSICVDYLKTVQNSIIADNLKSGKKDIRTEDISQDAIVAYIMSESVGDKWDSNRVAQWFNENIAITFTEKLMEKGLSDTDIDNRLAVTQKRFAESLSSKAKIPSQVAEKLTQVLKLADCENDIVYKRFYAKLNPPTIAEALDFGF